jgi:hypothetical protein
MSIKKIVVFVFLIGSLYARADPIKIGGGPGVDTYVSPADITPIEDGFLIKTISNYYEPMGRSNGIDVKSVEWIYEVKCSSNLHRLMRAVSFSGAMGSGGVLATAPANQKWEAMPSGSVYDVMQKAYCK